MSEENTLEPVELATELTIAWLNNPNNRVSADDVPAFLRTMYATISELANGGPAAAADAAKGEEFPPAVSVRRSLASKDHILSLIDGKPYKTLTRHLSTHGLTQSEYRRRYNLRPDYPMVAENYAAHRRELAKRIGLGRRPAAPAAAPVDAPAPKVTKAKAAAKPAAPKRSRAKAAPTAE